MRTAEKVSRFGRGKSGHVFHIWVYLLGIVAVVRCLDWCELVVGWGGARAAMEAESQKKDRSSYSLGLVQVIL